MSIAYTRSTSFLLFISVIVLVSMISLRDAHATQCWSNSLINEKEDPIGFVESLSEVIFIGTATVRFSEVFETIDKPGIATTVSEKTLFTVEAVHKGDLVAGQDVTVEGKIADCSCIGNFTLGEKYLVYAIIDDRTGKIMLRYCNFMKKIE